jgi:hypothetical protein
MTLETIMLSLANKPIMLNAIMLNVVMLNVVALLKRLHLIRWTSDAKTFVLTTFVRWIFLPNDKNLYSFIQKKFSAILFELSKRK